MLTLKMLSSPSTDDASDVDTNENNPRKPKKMDDVWRDQSLGLGSSSSTSSGGGDTAAEGPTFNNNKTKLTLRHRSVPRMGVRMQEFLTVPSAENHHCPITHHQNQMESLFCLAFQFRYMRLHQLHIRLHRPTHHLQL